MAILNNVVQHRRGDLSSFQKSTIVLKDGEIAVAKNENGKKIAYVGDGINAISALDKMAIYADDVIGLGEYVKREDLDEYVTETELTETLADYATENELTAYVKPEDMGKYVTEDELAATLTGYVTSVSVKTPVTDTNKIVTQEDIKTIIEGAMHFIDVITRTEGQTDVEAINAYFTNKGITPVAGDVVVMADNTKEYVYNKDNAWREIGEDGTSAKIQDLSDRLDDDETIINQLTADVNALDDEIADIETQLTSYADIEAAVEEYETEKENYLKTLTMNGTENVVVHNALDIGTVVTDAEFLHTTVEEGLSAGYAVDISEDGKLTINITGIDAGEITED